MGLIAAITSHPAQVPAHITGAILIGVDLAPNLSVFGAFATILRLIACAARDSISVLAIP
jgi:arsenical pump membrane protein